MRGLSGGGKISLDITVEKAAAPADRKDGPHSGSGVAESNDQALLGDVFVWVKDGYLSALEYAWFTDETPTTMPPPERRFESDPLPG